MHKNLQAIPRSVLLLQHRARSLLMSGPTAYRSGHLGNARSSALQSISHDRFWPIAAAQCFSALLRARATRINVSSTMPTSIDQATKHGSARGCTNACPHWLRAKHEAKRSRSPTP